MYRDNKLKLAIENVITTGNKIPLSFGYTKYKKDVQIKNNKPVVIINKKIVKKATARNLIKRRVKAALQKLIKEKALREYFYVTVIKSIPPYTKSTQYYNEFVKKIG